MRDRSIPDFASLHPGYELTSGLTQSGDMQWLKPNSAA
jgi:hypothetical protein